MTHMTSEMQACVQACMDCHRACTEMMMQCMKMGNCDSNAMKTMMDCAQMCQMCADFMMRDSMMSPKVCMMCEEMCRMCAAACEPMAKNDSMMMDCMKACLACAETCKTMAMKAQAA